MIYKVRHGSRYGLSYYGSFGECPRRKKYEEQDDRLPLLIGKLGLGTIFHAFQDIYHAEGKVIDPSAIEFENARVDEPTRRKAEALFNTYQFKHRPDHWGEVLSTEQEVLIDVAGHPYTAAIDMVVRMDESTALKHNVAPGVWLLDWKTVYAVTPTSIASYRHSLQSLAYQYAYKTTINEGVNGLLYVLIPKNGGDPHCLPTYPHPRAKEFLESYIVRKAAERERLENEPLIGHIEKCRRYRFGEFETCPYIDQCPRV